MSFMELAMVWWLESGWSWQMSSKYLQTSIILLSDFPDRTRSFSVTFGSKLPTHSIFCSCAPYGPDLSVRNIIFLRKIVLSATTRFTNWLASCKAIIIVEKHGMLLWQAWGWFLQAQDVQEAVSWKGRRQDRLNNGRCYQHRASVCHL